MTQTDPSSPIEDEVVALADALFENRISVDQSRRLEHLVVSRPELAEIYAGYTHLWCALPLHVVPLATSLLELADGGKGAQPLTPGDSMIVPAIRVVAEKDQSIAAPTIRIARKPDRSVAPVLGVWNRERDGRRFLPGWRWAAAASILLAVSVVAWWAQPWGARAATLAETVDAQWIGAPADPGTKLSTGNHVRLASGLAKIRFDGGATVVLEGPADLRIDGRGQAELESGKLTATVPVPARGFAVQTLSSRVVDLGTEFGVESLADGSSHVEVFRGKVEADALRPAAGATPVLALIANQAADVPADGGSVASATPAPEAFTSEQEFNARSAAKAGSSYDRWLAYSYALRRDPSAVLYYTFDRDPAAPDQLTNHAAAAAGRWNIPLNEHRPAWSTGRWAQKGAMSFEPAKSPRLFLKDMPLAEDNKLTVCVWVFARSRPRYASIAKNWKFDFVYGQFHLGLYDDRGDLEDQINQVNRQYHMLEETGSPPFPIGTWEHVACVMDPDTVRLFRDGRMVGSSPCGKLNPNPVYHGLGIGCEEGTIDGFWDGKMDELAVFHRAFSADEIRRMYEAGKP